MSKQIISSNNSAGSVKKMGLSNIREQFESLKNRIEQHAAENNCKKQLMPFLHKVEELNLFSAVKNISTELIFLEKIDTVDLDILQKWLPSTEQQISIDNPISILHSEEFDLKIDSRFYDFSPRILSDDKKIDFRILVYNNPDIDLEKFNIILSELSLEIPCIFLVGMNAGETIKKHKLKLYTNTSYIYTFHRDELQSNGLLGVISDDTFKPKLSFLKLIHQVNSLLKSCDIITRQINHKKRNLKSDSLLSERELLKYELKESDVTNKDVVQLKNQINRIYSPLYRIIEKEKALLEKRGEDVFLDKVAQEVEQLDKFKSEEKGKSNILFIPQGVLDAMVQKNLGLLRKSFKQTIEQIKKKQTLVEVEIKHLFKELNVDSPLLYSHSVKEELVEETLKQNMILEKEYERSMTKKGWSSLMSDIRGPLFMLMPLMMMASIFASFFVTEDVGSVLKNEIAYNNRPAVIITKLPDKYAEKGFKRFAENYLFGRTGEHIFTRNQIFELNVIQRKEVTKNSFGKSKEKIIKQNDYIVKEDRLIVFLHKDASHKEVVTKLMDPANNLLVIEASSRGGGGITALYRLGSFFGEYRYLVLFSIVALFSWFIRKKSKEFDTDRNYNLTQQKKTLIKDLQTEFDKIIRKSIISCSTKLTNHLKKQEDGHQVAAYKKLTNHIDNNKQNLLEQGNISKRREKNIQTKEIELSETERDLIKISKDLIDLSDKCKNLLSTV